MPAAREVIAPDFPLEFAGFFPREKSRKTRKNSGAFRENSGKKYRIFPSLFSSETAFYPIPTNVLMYQHARPPPPGMPRPARPTRPASTRPAPARSGPLHHLLPIFPSVPNFSLVLQDFSRVLRIFPGCYLIFPSCRNRVFPSWLYSPIVLMPPCRDGQNDDMVTMCPSLVASC